MMATLINNKPYLTIVALSGSTNSRVAYVQDGVGFDSNFDEIGEVDEFNNLLNDADVVKRAKSKAKNNVDAELINDVLAAS
jgi:hypothetical protein